MYALSEVFGEREDIPDIFGPSGKAAENADILPRMRAITALWDAGFAPYTRESWRVYTNAGEFVLSI